MKVTIHGFIFNLFSWRKPTMLIVGGREQQVTLSVTSSFNNKWALSVILKFTSHVFTFEERSICLTSHLLPAIPPHSYARSLQKKLRTSPGFPIHLFWCPTGFYQSYSPLQRLFSTLLLAITILNPSVWLFRPWALPTWLLSLCPPVSEYCLLIRQFSVICWEHCHFCLWATAVICL